VLLLTPARGALSNLVAVKAPRSASFAGPEPGARLRAAADIPLRATELRSAFDIALSWRGMRKFTGSQRPTLVDSGPWTSQDGTGRLIGAEMVLRLASPRTINAVWPSTAFVSKSRYVHTDQRFRASNVRELTVDVDLRTGKVVSIAPDEHARVKVPANARQARHLPAVED
jgi:hypothetical protein